LQCRQRDERIARQLLAGLQAESTEPFRLSAGT
jgi:hypothetical protein